MNIQELLTNYRFNIEAHNDKTLISFNNEHVLLDDIELIECHALFDSMVMAIKSYIDLKG